MEGDGTGAGEPAGTSASEPIAFCGPDGTVTGWAEGARRLLGYAPADIVGRPVAEMLP
ncbi:MAG: PAS domain-containing protein, partial [Streptomycetaceae bacterium]|nr:PAS domain-containing protein [Streptomycetaceae bacterium]